MSERERPTDREIDQLLEGGYEGSEFADVQGILDALREADAGTVDESATARYVAAAVTASLRPGGRVRGSAPGSAPRHTRRLRRPAAVGLVSMLTLLVGMSGVAWAANSSKPGDSLYGLDRTFESIGIGNGGSRERFAEVRALFVAGDLTRMLDHMTNVIPSHDVDTESATTALREAAESVRGSAAVSSETLAAVSELLAYLTNHLDRVDAAEIADIAGHIRTRGFDPPETGLTPADPTDPSGFKEKE